MTSLAFPFDPEALVALKSYAKNGHDYLFSLVLVSTKQLTMTS
jgi:hypothetical protein